VNFCGKPLSKLKDALHCPYLCLRPARRPLLYHAIEHCTPSVRITHSVKITQCTWRTLKDVLIWTCWIEYVMTDMPATHLNSGCFASQLPTGGKKMAQYPLSSIPDIISRCHRRPTLFRGAGSAWLRLRLCSLSWLQLLRLLCGRHRSVLRGRLRPCNRRNRQQLMQSPIMLHVLQASPSMRADASKRKGQSGQIVSATTASLQDEYYQHPAGALCGRLDVEKGKQPEACREF
jgi:hypothetical protein